MKLKTNIKADLTACITAALALIFITLPAVSNNQIEPSAAAKENMIALPSPKLDGPVSLEKALAARRSIREFSGGKFTMEQVGQLLWSGQGITEKTRGLRTAPSAGAIYPIELYAAIPEGLFLYKPDGHKLEKITDSDIRSKLSEASMGQRWAATAGCDIIIAGSEKKLAGRYRDRARLYLVLEAGHIAQNILLQAVSLDLGAVPIGAFYPEQVKSVCSLPDELEPLYIISVGFPQGQQAEQKEKGVSMESKKDKKAVLIIASRNFRDEELFETKKALENAGIETITASSKTGTITGMLGGKAEAAITTKNVDVNDYDAVIFIGGMGAQEYFNDKTAQDIAKAAADRKKILAAICIAPSTLANAGVLKGKNVTSFASERVNLTSKGAKYTGSDVEQDGLVITGNGPAAAEKFGKTIVKALEQ